MVGIFLTGQINKVYVVEFYGVEIAHSAGTSLSISPATKTVASGQTFTANILLDTAGIAIDGVDIFSLHYNPLILQIQDADNSTAGVQITPGALLSQTLVNTVNNNNGTVQFSQVTTASTTFNGAGTLATITFKAIASGTSAVTIDFSPGSTSDSNVAGGGVERLTSVSNASFVVTSASSPPPPSPSPTPTPTPSPTPTPTPSPTSTSGGSGSSSKVVKTPDTTLPVVSITSHINKTIVSGTAATIGATAVDNIGVAGVTFKLDGAALGLEDTTLPYSMVWNSVSVANGTHTLTAVARDVAGNIATSSPVIITVANTTTNTQTTPTVATPKTSTTTTKTPSSSTQSGVTKTGPGTTPTPFDILNPNATETISTPEDTGSKNKIIAAISSSFEKIIVFFGEALFTLFEKTGNFLDLIGF